jgi:regulator of RNase E activity RraA
VQIERRDSGADFKPMYEVLSAVQAGKVLVIAGAIEIGGAIWGEILTASAQQAGFVGVAIDGFVRDVTAMQNLELPIYASGTAVVGPLGRAHVVSVGETVNIFGQEVSSGDQIVLDDSGCVRLASRDAQEILEAAALYEKGEEQVLQALAAGERLNSAYRYKADVVSRLKR